ncbi:MAG: hypothetical protein WBC98_04565, partial [Candidatus Zixiibacteriota bacterium]
FNRDAGIQHLPQHEMKSALLAGDVPTDLWIIIPSQPCSRMATYTRGVEDEAGSIPASMVFCGGRIYATRALQRPPGLYPGEQRWLTGDMS